MPKVLVGLTREEAQEQQRKWFPVACACFGPTDGDPLCGCRMAARGVYLKNNKWYEIGVDVDVELPATEFEQTEFDVALVDSGPNTILTLKAIRELSGLGLLDSKRMFEKIPFVFKEGASEYEAERIKSTFEKAGARVELT